MTTKTSSFSEVESAIDLIPSKFHIVVAEANELAERVRAVKIDDVEDEQQYAVAREALHEARSAHGAIESRRKELKGPVVRAGKAIDAVAKELKAIVAPARDAVQAEVDKVKAHEEAKALAELERRLEALRPFRSTVHRDAIAALSHEGFEELVQAEKERFEREEAEREAERQRVKKLEEAAAREREAERQRVKKLEEAAARERAAREEEERKRREGEAQAKAQAEADAARIAELEAKIAAEEERKARAEGQDGEQEEVQEEEEQEEVQEEEEQEEEAEQPAPAPAQPAVAFAPTAEGALAALVAVAEGFLDLFPGAGEETPEGRLATKARVALKLHQETSGRGAVSQ